MENANIQLLKRQSDLDIRRKIIEDSYLGKVVDKIGRDSVDKAVTQALENPKNMRQLLKATDKTSRKALQRKIWEKAEKYHDINDFILDHEASLKQVFGTQHLQNLTIIQGAKDMLGNVKLAHGRPDKVHLPKAVKVVEEKIGMTLPQIGTRIYAWIGS